MGGAAGSCLIPDEHNIWLAFFFSAVISLLKQYLRVKYTADLNSVRRLELGRDQDNPDLKPPQQQKNGGYT